MAFLDGKGGFTGSLGNLSAYQPKGSDKIILRTKGGADKKRIKQHPNFARVRSNNAEFGSCSKMAGHLRGQLHPFVNMVDHNLNAAFSALNKTIQLLDTTKPPGQRSICYSQHGYLLVNYAFNRRHGFDTVLRYPLQAVLNREQASATLMIPTLQPGIHLHFPWQLPYYRLIVHFFVLCDLVHDGRYYAVQTARHTVGYCPHFAFNWLPVTANRPGKELVLFIHTNPSTDPTTAAPFPLEDKHSLVLAAGIQMGKPGQGDTIQETQYCGTGKILAVG